MIFSVSLVSILTFALEPWVYSVMFYLVMDAEEMHTFVGESASGIQAKLRRHLVVEKGVEEILWLDHRG